MRAHTHDDRGSRAIAWIEQFCLYPDGPKKGKRVRLSQPERWQLRLI